MSLPPLITSTSPKMRTPLKVTKQVIFSPMEDPFDDESEEGGNGPELQLRDYVHSTSPQRMSPVAANLLRTYESAPDNLNNSLQLSVGQTVGHQETHISPPQHSRLHLKTNDIIRHSTDNAFPSFAVNFATDLAVSLPMPVQTPTSRKKTNTTSWKSANEMRKRDEKSRELAAKKGLSIQNRHDFVRPNRVSPVISTVKLTRGVSQSQHAAQGPTPPSTRRHRHGPAPVVPQTRRAKSVNQSVGSRPDLSQTHPEFHFNMPTVSLLPHDDDDGDTIDIETKFIALIDIVRKHNASCLPEHVISVPSESPVPRDSSTDKKTKLSLNTRADVTNDDDGAYVTVAQLLVQWLCHDYCPLFYDQVHISQIDVATFIVSGGGIKNCLEWLCQLVWRQEKFHNIRSAMQRVVMMNTERIKFEKSIFEHLTSRHTCLLPKRIARNLTARDIRSFAQRCDAGADTVVHLWTLDSRKAAYNSIEELILAVRSLNLEWKAQRARITKEQIDLKFTKQMIIAYTKSSQCKLFKVDSSSSSPFSQNTLPVTHHVELSEKEDAFLETCIAKMGGQIFVKNLQEMSMNAKMRYAFRSYDELMRTIMDLHAQQVAERDRAMAASRLSASGLLSVEIPNEDDFITDVNPVYSSTRPRTPSPTPTPRRARPGFSFEEDGLERMRSHGSLAQS